MIGLAVLIAARREGAGMAAAVSAPRAALLSLHPVRRTMGDRSARRRFWRYRPVILDWLEQITQRQNVIALAVVGAGFAALGANAVARRLRIGPRSARWLLRCGYTAMWTSVALFTIAGFLPADS